VAHYLALLEDAYLVAALERFSIRAHRRRAAPPKLVTLNNALLSGMHPSGPPDPSREPERFGFWVENACLAFAVNPRSARDVLAGGAPVPGDRRGVGGDLG